MFRIVEAIPLPGFRLRLTFADGVRGEVDLSDMAGRGVFSAWDRPGVFEKVQIGSSGEVKWGEEIDLCPDALYLEITGQTPEDVFPVLRERAARAGD